MRTTYRLREALPNLLRRLIPVSCDCAALRQSNDDPVIQHDAPVDYFGGVEAFEATKRRDPAKKSKCARPGIALIEVREGYGIDVVVASIRSARGWYVSSGAWVAFMGSNEPAHP